MPFPCNAHPYIPRGIGGSHSLSKQGFTELKIGTWREFKANVGSVAGGMILNQAQNVLHDQTAKCGSHDVLPKTTPKLQSYRHNRRIASNVRTCTSRLIGDKWMIETTADAHLQPLMSVPYFQRCTSCDCSCEFLPALAGCSTLVK